jgi:3-methyl-2-oxobutanoate hydroxymethyltransferase
MLAERGVPVCAHLGLTPQSVNKFGGFRVQGRDDASAEKILADAKLLAEAGADLLVLECVPAALGARITREIAIPTIGIGAGRDTDAQVLVINDILGLTEQPPKFSKNFLLEANDIPGAMQKYVADVKAGTFPSDDNIFI